jgi:hypothetical protein
MAEDNPASKREDFEDARNCCPPVNKTLNINLNATLNSRTAIFQGILSHFTKQENHHKGPYNFFILTLRRST